MFSNIAQTTSLYLIVNDLKKKPIDTLLGTCLVSMNCILNMQDTFICVKIIEQVFYSAPDQMLHLSHDSVLLCSVVRKHVL